MKKFFLLIPALVLSLAINAATTPVSAGVNTLTSAVLDASSGDILELGDGIFYEEGNFDMNKDLTIKAAEGAHPVIANRFYLKIVGGADITFQGIKFDGAAWRNGNADPIGAYDYCFRSYSASTGEEDVQFIDCEFTGYPSYILYTQRADRRWNSITIRGCFFYNNKKSAVNIDNVSGEKQSCNALTIENSTFANFTENYDVIYYNAPDAEHTTTLSVNHCTFYGHPKRAIYWQKSENLSVSNCVFSQPSSVSYKSVECVAGTISNSLSYNSAGYSSAATRTDNIVLDPLFVDPANNDFTLHNASPARRENGTVYGDPRWAKAIEPITIPATLQPIDAMLSDSAGVELGTPDCINFKALGSHEFNDTEYAKWPITVDKAGKYKFTANVKSTNSQKYTFSVLDSNEQPIANGTIEQTSDIGSGEKSFSTNVLDLTAGEYFVKIVNTYSWSNGQVVNVTASYEGGGIVEVPATLLPVDALRSEYAQLIHGTVDTLTFARLDHEWEADDADYTVDGSQYVKWNINIQKAGKYKFTANTYCTQGHNYRMILLSENETSTIGTWLEKDDISEYDFHSNVDYPVSTPVLDLTPGNYVFKMQAREKGRVMSVIASYEGGAISNVPGQLVCEDAVLEATKMSHNADGDIAYGDNGNPRNEYAYWNIHADEACNLTVSFDIAPGSTSGHEFLIELHNNVGKIDSVEETELTKYLSVPAAGDYTLKLINRTQWSSAILHSITFTPYVAPAGVTMVDTDTDNTAWVANVGGNAVNVQMNRTILGGMYNTICLPFKVSSTQCKAIFGNDVELYTLGSATLSGDILNLQFNTASDIWNGTPILIKTSSDIVNPLFENVIIESETADHTNGGFATFQGTFVQKEFHNGDQVLLLLANDMLAYPQQDRTLKGFRAYFQINGGANNAPVIRGARIVAGTQVVTAIDLVDAQNEGIQKVVENGQLIIIKNGIRYNVMGAQIQ